MRVSGTTIALLAISSLLTGCSNIGKINGQDVSRVAGNNPNAPYCQRNPGVCIIGIAVGLGGTAALIHHTRKNKRNVVQTASPAPPVPVPPPAGPPGVVE